MADQFADSAVRSFPRPLSSYLV
uniref:Uncharacterized protein n=1 Tax=Arundo donax TaxID=35708 RepID=A0A0A9FLV0_ARUDO